MVKTKRTITDGLNYLMEDEHERIVFGVLKKLHVAPFMLEFEDYVQEARLTFAKAYVHFPNDPREHDMKFHVYAYQAMYWRLLDLMKKSNLCTDHVGICLDDADNNLELPQPTRTDVLDKITGEELFQKLFLQCTPIERQFLQACYVDQLSGGEIARRLHITRQALYRIRKKVGNKALRLVESGAK